MNDTIEYRTTRVWKKLLYTLMREGSEVSQQSAGAAWRGKANRELLGYQSVIPMSQPIIVSPARKLGYRFLAAEAAWICGGDNRVQTIVPYAKVIKDLSDDGKRFFGAYGPKFIDQLSFVVETLTRDPFSRQAVINVWREQPRPTKDTPCTLSWQFIIRDKQLHCIASMRSSDVWTGWVYDVFNFSMAAAVVALEFREVQFKRGITLDDPAFIPLQLGNLYLTAGSQHLYLTDLDDVHRVLNEPIENETLMQSLNLNFFSSSEHLLEHLWKIARKEIDVSPYLFMP